MNYLVFGSWVGERVILMRSSTGPSRVSTTLGIEHMQPRVISFGVSVLLALGFLFGIARFVMAALRSDVPYAPVPPWNRRHGRTRLVKRQGRGFW